MLTLFDTNRLGRRDFLRVGTFAPWIVGPLGAAARTSAGFGAAPVDSVAAESSARRIASEIDKGVSIVLLFLHGGPSQIETFDPKMTAPAEIRSVQGEVATTLPGITFGRSFPRLAQLAHQLAIVRSFTTGDANHDIKPVVSRSSWGASVGAWHARALGTMSPDGRLPNNVILYPRAVDPSTQAEQLAFGDFRATGPLGAGYAPVALGAGGGFQDDLRLRIPLERLADRRHLLNQLDRLRRQFDQQLPASSGLREQAFASMLGDAAGALDWSREDNATIARYDTAPLVRPDQIDRRWKNYDNYVDNAKTLGRLLLMARRLCERGCRFVTVTTNFVWDMHADINNATMDEGMRYMGPPLDFAVSAFISDCLARGLDRRILLVCCGEMGRTPRLNSLGGRDHWGQLAPLLVFGGGLKMGQVIGQSNRDAAEPHTEPMTIAHLLGTMVQSQIDVGRLRLQPGLPREVSTWTGYPTIPELFA